MQLTEHFTLEELTFSSTAVARGIDNSPLPETVKHLAVLAQGLERVRGILSAPIDIDSGYRCPSLNGIVRGVQTSAHLTGYAADFLCPQFGSPLTIVQRLAAETALQFDQMIQEGTWVHISFAPTMRRQVLTAHFDSGVATYTHGV
jgi:hypothetical protein